MRFLACLAAAALLAATLSAEEHKGAKVTKIGEKLLITLDVNGKEVQLTAYPFLKGYGADGKELVGVGQGVRVLKEGNVLDLKTESLKLTGQPQIYISEARLIKGDLQSLEVLRGLTAKNLPTGKNAATPGKIVPKSKKGREPDPATTFTVVKYEPKQAVVLRGANGNQITAKAAL